MKTPIIQAIGKNHFVLLELVPKKEISLQPHDEVYLGEGKRDQIHHINGRLSPAKMTPTARSELEYVLADIVKKEEQKFVSFFNTAQPLSTRMHSLELIPGMGKKRMWEILDERRKEEFASFEDLRKRVKLIPDPEKAVVKRILEEIAGNEKHCIFVKQ